MVIDGFMEENGLAPPLPKSSPTKKIFVGRGYRLENKDAKTDYEGRGPKVVRNGKSFFLFCFFVCFRFIFTIFYICREFSSPT